MSTPSTIKTSFPVAHNNQIQLGVILAAHYSAARASVDDWLKRRDQYLMLFITGTGAAFGLFLSRGTSPLLLYLIAPFTLVIVCAYISTDFHIAFLCKWLQVEYTSILERYVATYGVISLEPWHWDNSMTLAEFYASGTVGLRYLFLCGTFLLANIAAPFLAWTVFKHLPVSLLLFTVASTLFSCISLALVYGKRKRMASGSVKINESA